MSNIVVFENAGVIDPVAIRTFGVSVKETENPIGFFGTGLKYALAILLRTGHQVTIQAGADTLRFGVTPHTIRGQEFGLVTMDDVPMGFTTQVGKTWELWMAYRELHCNCTDEGGSIYVADEVPEPKDGVTRVIVVGDEFREAYNTRSGYILFGEPFLRLGDADVHTGESRGIFYRGILVHRFPQAETSRFTYNMTRQIDLTEDRTAKYPSLIPMYLAASILEAKDEDFLRDLLTTTDRYEAEFNFRSEGVWGVPKPTKAFLSTVENLSIDRAARTNVSAVKRYREHVAKDLMPATTILSGVEAEMLERAIAFCKEFLRFDVDGYPIVVTDTLGQGVLGMAKGQTIFLSRLAFMQGTKRLASTLVEEFIHLKHGYADETREFEDFLIDRLVSLGEEMRGDPL